MGAVPRTRCGSWKGSQTKRQGWRWSGRWGDGIYCLNWFPTGIDLIMTGYICYTPHVSAFFDRNGDGIAEDSKDVSNIAFGFKDRPADHTTNGLDLGVDGSIYVAGGDFGFVEAKSIDGRKLQNRGGGVYWFRPDGSDWNYFPMVREIFLLFPPVIMIFLAGKYQWRRRMNVGLITLADWMTMDIPLVFEFCRWDYISIGWLRRFRLRRGLHSRTWFSQRMGKCPFTCDWGRAGLYRHRVERKGAGLLKQKHQRIS